MKINEIKVKRGRMMEKIYVFGHKNPDTDTICSAIAYANLKQKLGMNVEAIRLGEIGAETAYVLNHFNVLEPRLVEKVSKDVSQVILVDHNEFQQSADDIRDVEILEVIDHHRIANFETAGPLYYRAEPVGCTATILYKIYQENNVDISKEMAGLMCSAIVSDSLLFKSPTCTQADVEAAKQLAEIAGIDVKQYGLDMLKAGADLSDKTAHQLINLDAKSFTMGKSTVRVAQVNTVDEAEVLSKKAALEKEMQAEIQEQSYDLFLLVITNILTNDSVGLAFGPKAEAVEKAFDVKLENHTAILKGVVSRKKQVVPNLTDVFSN